MKLYEGNDDHGINVTVGAIIFNTLSLVSKIIAPTVCVCTVRTLNITTLQMFLLSEEVAKLSFLSVSAGDTDCGAECQVSQDYPCCLPRSTHRGSPGRDVS